MIRRFGETVRTGQKYRRRPGVYALLLDGDQILTTFQQNPLPEFQLPGGGIDPGEQPIAALHREVIEETGWRIQVQKRLGAFRRFCYMPDYALWAEKLCTIYLARPIRPICAPTEAGHTAVWLPVGEALQLLGNAGDRAFLAQALGTPS